MGGIPHLSISIQGTTLHRLESYLTENTNTPSAFLRELSESAGILGRNETNLSAEVQSGLMDCANDNLDRVNFTELARLIREQVLNATS